MRDRPDPVEPSPGHPGRARGTFDRFTFVVAWVLLLVIGALTLFVVWLVLRDLTALVIGSMVVLAQVWFFFRFRELRQEVARLRETVSRLQRDGPRDEPGAVPGSVEATYR